MTTNLVIVIAAAFFATSLAVIFGGMVGADISGDVFGAPVLATLIIMYFKD